MHTLFKSMLIALNSFASTKVLSRLSTTVLVFVSLVFGLSQAVNAAPMSWGYGGNGQLGNGTFTSPQSTPVTISGSVEFSVIKSGYQHSLAVKPDGTVWAWGYNGYGQLGDDTRARRATPVQVSGLSNVVDVAGGTYHSMALQADGTVWAWGYGRHGAIGRGSRWDSLTPVRLTSLTNVIAIAAKGYHSIALKSDGTVWAWGYNYHGEVGNGTFTTSYPYGLLTPVQVSGLSGVVSIASGAHHSLAVKSDGTVWAWGYNYYGSVGNGTTSPYSPNGVATPVQVSGLTGVVKVAAGLHHSLAVKSDGSVWAWGYNGNGAVGDGTYTHRATPVQVSGLSGATDVAAGHHSLAVKSDGTVWAWGYGYYGQMGNGTTSTSTIPGQTSGLTGMGAVSAGWYHSIAYIGGGVANQPPTADAGVNITAECDSTDGVEFAATAITLDGSGSSDPDGDTLTYSWSHQTLGVLGTGATLTVGLTGGSHNIALEVNDGKGGTSTSTIVVTVEDTTAPYGLQAGADVTLEATSVAGAAYDPITGAGAADLCDASLQYSASPTPASYPLGNTLVTISATDDSGNFSQAIKGITVEDTTPPVMMPPADVSVEANDVLSTVNIGTATATDIFGATVANDAPAAGFPLGSTIVTYTATDGNGLTTTGTQTVTVADTTAPVLTVPANVSIEANAVLSSVALGTATATDIFGATVENNAPAAGFPLGSTTVTYTATDGNGLTTTGTQTVTVSDTTAPVLSVPANVSIEANAVLSSVALGTATATDIFGATVTDDAPAAGFPLGTTTVTYTAVDGNGLTTTGTQTVTVADTTAPVLNVPANVSIEANAVLSTVAQGTATATDIFGATVTNDAPVTFGLGTTTVTYTATDGNGLTTTGTQTVTVADTTAPVLTVPANVSIEANAVLSTVALGTATATDIFGATVTNDAPATFPLGSTTVTYTATDGNGLITTGIQTVTVADTTAPALTVPANVNIEANAVLSTVALGTATATDIFNPVTVSSNAPATYPLGTTVVTWTAIDANGNVATGTQNVNVVDTTAPVVTAALVPYSNGDEEDQDKNKDSDEGRFKVQFTVTDIVDANPVVTAVLMINGYATPVTVTNGQIVEFEYEDEKTEVEVENGVVEIEAPALTFNVTGTDASGNSATASAQPQGLTRDNDDDYQGKHGKKAGKHVGYDD